MPRTYGSATYNCSLCKTPIKPRIDNSHIVIYQIECTAIEPGIAAAYAHRSTLARFHDSECWKEWQYNQVNGVNQ